MVAKWGGNRSIFAFSQYILGFKPDYDGLCIDPCIPKAWKEYSVTRVFHIKVANPSGINRGVTRIFIDKKEVEGNRLPLFADRKKHTVDVTMG